MIGILGNSCVFYCCIVMFVQSWTVHAVGRGTGRWSDAVLAWTAKLCRDCPAD